jgi:hypothetical protein
LKLKLVAFLVLCIHQFCLGQKLLEELPLVDTKYINYQTSSFDRTGRNRDGYASANATDSVLHGKINNPTGTSDGTYEYILFHQKENILVNRFWLTDFNPNTIIRIYLDGRKNPTIEKNILDFFSLDSCLVHNFYNSSGGNISYVPIHAKDDIVITSSTNDGYYNLQYTKLPLDSNYEEIPLTTLQNYICNNGKNPKASIGLDKIYDTLITLLPNSSFNSNKIVGGGSINAIYLSSPTMESTKWVTDDIRSHKGSSKFSLRVLPNANNYVLRRRVKCTQTTPTQNAQVLIDNINAGNWNYITNTRNYQIWEDIDFKIPKQYCIGKNSINLEIKALSGNNVITEGYYWILCDGIIIDSIDIGNIISENFHNYSVINDRNMYTYTSTYLMDKSKNYIQTLASNFININFDNNMFPQISVPLGLFFGTGSKTLAPSQAIICGNKEDTLYNFLSMPFWENFSLSLINNSNDTQYFHLKIDYSLHNYYDKDKTGYLHNFYANKQYNSSDTFVEILKANGTGKYIGTILEGSQYDNGVVEENEYNNWLEGDELFYIDDLSTPNLYGTGTEDFFNCGFYFAFNNVSLPFHGMIYEDTLYERTCYRYNILDPINFNKNINLYLEHGNWNTKKSIYKINTWYYLKDSTTIETCDSIDFSSMGSLQQHNYIGHSIDSSITSVIEGIYDNIVKTIFVKNILDSCVFDINIPITNNGIRLVRTFDNNKIAQQAEVYIDDNLVGTWYHHGVNIFQRIKEDIFEIPSSFTKEKNMLHIKLIPTSEPFNINYLKAYYYKGVKLVSSLQTNEKKQEITIYPNPASEYINLQTIDTYDFYEIYDMKGQILMSKKHTPNTPIEINLLPSGEYSLRIFKGKYIVGDSKFVKL